MAHSSLWYSTRGSFRSVECRAAATGTRRPIVMVPLEPQQGLPATSILSRQPTGSEQGPPSSSTGIVIAKKQVSMMPAVRAAAAEAAKQLPAYRPANALHALSPLTISTPAASVDVEVEASAVGIRERPSDRDFSWANDSYSELQRTLDTWWLLDQKLSYIGGMTEAKKLERTRDLARYLLNSVLNLGPTFIKLGQLSSTRSDLFPAAFVEELSELQDRVPAFSFEKARAIIELDLGKPLETLFKSFDPRPIAAASLGQVHCAVLWTGEKVAVKVQRPGLKQLFDIDLKNLKLLAVQLDKQDEANRDFKGIYQECADVLYEEIDYLNEGRNADKFRRNFAATPWVVVPRIFWEYCSPRVLTLEYIPGVKISDKAALVAQGTSTDLVAQRATEAYLQQILRHGFFHADPHPGNVSVDQRGNLIFYDFGMMGEIGMNVRERLVDLFRAIYKQNTTAVIEALTELKVIKASGDQMTLKRTIGYFITNLSKQTERQETIAAIGEDLFAIAVDQPFRFPATFTFVLRAFSTLEGIGKTLNPKYSFADVAKPYAAELLSLQAPGTSAQAMVLNQLSQQAQELGQAAAAMPQRVQRMDSVMASLETGDLKLRVRVLEAERAARRAGVMQGATLNAVGAAAFLNLGAMVSMNGHVLEGNLALAAAGVFSVLIVLGLRRVRNLDKFESDMKG